MLPCPLIKQLPEMGGSAWTDGTNLLAARLLAKATGNGAIGLIPVGNIPDDKLQAFSAELNRALKGRELIVSTDLLETSRCATQLLVASKEL